MTRGKVAFLLIGGPVVAVYSQVFSRGGLDEPGGGANALPGLLDAGFAHVAHI